MLNYSFTGKNITVSDNLKEKTVLKLNRLEKLFPDGTEVRVAYSVIKQECKMEVMVKLNKRYLRAEVATDNMHATIDAIADVLEHQMVKFKKRLQSKARRDSAFKEEYSLLPESESAEAEHEIVIERTKRFAVKPMDAEEAAMELELLGHSFYVFRNGATDQINVIYKRADGAFGLIEPDAGV